MGWGREADFSSVKRGRWIGPDMVGVSGGWCGVDGGKEDGGLDRVEQRGGATCVGQLRRTFGRRSQEGARSRGPPGGPPGARPRLASAGAGPVVCMIWSYTEAATDLLRDRDAITVNACSEGLDELLRVAESGEEHEWRVALEEVTTVA